MKACCRAATTLEQRAATSCSQLHAGVASYLEYPSTSCVSLAYESRDSGTLSRKGRPTFSVLGRQRPLWLGQWVL